MPAAPEQSGAWHRLGHGGGQFPRPSRAGGHRPALLPIARLRCRDGRTGASVSGPGPPPRGRAAVAAAASAPQGCAPLLPTAPAPKTADSTASTAIAVGTSEPTACAVSSERRSPASRSSNARPSADQGASMPARAAVSGMRAGGLGRGRPVLRPTSRSSLRYAGIAQLEHRFAQFMQQGAPGPEPQLPLPPGRTLPRMHLRLALLPLADEVRKRVFVSRIHLSDSGSRARSCRAEFRRPRPGFQSCGSSCASR